MTITKTKYLDKVRYIWILIFSLLFMIFSICLDREIFQHASRYLNEPGFMEIAITHALTDNIVVTNVYEWVYYAAFHYVSFDYLMIFGTFLFQIILPFFGSLAGFWFLKKLNSIYSFSIVKTKSYRIFLIKQIAKNSFFISIPVFISFIIFYVFVFKITNGKLDESLKQFPRELFQSIFGKNFYVNHTYAYWFLEGFLKLFIMPFIYSFFAQAFCLVSRLKKHIILAPCIYYFGLSVIGASLFSLGFDKISIYLTPSAIMASGDYSNINTFLILFTNSIPLFIGLIFINMRTKNVEIT